MLKSSSAFIWPQLRQNSCVASINSYLLIEDSYVLSSSHQPFSLGAVVGALAFQTLSLGLQDYQAGK